VTGTDEAAFSAALTTLWQKHRGTNLDRIDLLEQVAAAALRGTLDEHLRDEGERSAHKLAGSLGTFGLERAARQALEAEALLRAPSLDCRRLAEAVVGLRHAMGSEAASSTNPVRHADQGAADPPLPRVEQPVGANTACPPAAERAFTLLAVVADPELTSILVADCSANGVALVIVEDATSAVAALAEQPVDAALVVVDPAGPAGAALDEITRGAPTFVMSDRDTFADRLEALRAGAVGFLPRRQSVRQTLSFIIQVLVEDAARSSVVLVVDDDPVVVDIVQVVLHEPNRQVVAVTDAASCWARLEESTPTVLVVDLGLPDVNGLELCRLVRADPRWHLLPPIVVLTAGADPGLVEQAFQAGADDFVTKPIEDHELRSRLRAQESRARLLHLLADVDPLTATENRRATERSLDRLVRVAGRRREPVSVALVGVDLDAVNAHEGTALGKSLLRRLGGAMRDGIRGEDLVGRWDDGTFLIALYGTSPEDALPRLAKLLEVITATPVRGTTGTELSVVCRAGVSSFPVDGTSVDTLVWAAQNALAQATQERLEVMSADGLGRSASAEHCDVLIIDDDESIADLVCQVLAGRGHTVRRLADGAEAAELLGDRQLTARVVILDVGLPGLDGFGVLRLLGDRGILAATRVFVLSARHSEAETLRALNLGATEFIAKPFRLPVLVQRIEQALATTERNQ